MPWADEQIRQRKLGDDELFSSSFVRMAGAVMGSGFRSQTSDEREIIGNAINEILDYYNAPVPEDEDTGSLSFYNELERRLRPSGIMFRDVKLTGNWYKDAVGPMLAFEAGDGHAVALLPDSFGRYFYRDYSAGKKVKVTGKTAEQLKTDAVCFYYPFDRRALKVRDLYKYLFRSMSKADIVMICLCAAAATALGYLLSSLYGILTGNVFRSGNPRMLTGIAVFMISTAVSSFLAGALKSIFLERIESRAAISAEAAGMMRILSLPPSFFKDYSSGELLQRLAYVKELCNSLLSLVLDTGVSLLFSLVYIGKIYSLSPILAVPALIVIAASCLLSITASLVQVRVTRRQMDLASKESGMTYAMIAGIQKIKNAGAEKRAFARWAELYSDETSVICNPPLYLKLNGVISSAVSMLGTIIIYLLAHRAGVQANDYMAFMVAYGLVAGAFSSLSSLTVNIAGIKPMSDMVKPILEAECETQENKQIVTDISGAIDVSNVSFRYTDDSPMILDDISLSIRKGDYVAIVGETGCGKSTLIRLLLGFEKPVRGAIYYDHRDLNSLDPVTLRRSIGSVLQNGQLMMGDLFQNITLSAPGLSMEDAWEAADLAGIADDIHNMPMGMFTMVAENGGGISGGQKQRILIARAVASKPKVLIFDEATSALDNITQKKISDALDRLSCTRIVIAHRLSTIRNCSRILVMRDGKIEEEGTYEDLIARNGYFADLVDRQRLDKA